MAKPGEPVTIEAPTMKGQADSRAPFGSLRAVDPLPVAWPPPGYVPVLVPVARAYELITSEDALPCRWTVEQPKEGE